MYSSKFLVWYIPLYTLYSFKLNGNEYVNGKLEYEGDYLYNKKCNGRGYNENDEIIYILKNGNGKVREYDDSGNLIFDGEYLNGKKSGKGKEYKSNGVLLFYGEYLDGQRWNGIGKEFKYKYEDYNDSYDIDLLEYEYLNGNRIDFSIRFL